MSTSSLCLALDAPVENVVRFDIPRQRADVSLTEFARQADITLIFPFTDAVKITTNALTGEYSVAAAVHKLLADTPLKVRVSEDGQFTIVSDHVDVEINPMQHKNKLSSAVIGVMTGLAGAPTLAQDQQVEEVIVTGIRGSLQRAMDVKRKASGVIDAISAEDIGKFPDTNLAESLQRITGVSIDRSGGEGQLITVRGFGPEFNTVLVNGRQIASEDRSRAFNFDTLASEMVSGLDVHKTSTATMQSGGLGATVNVKTARPLDFDGLKIAGSIKAVSDENSDETTPQFSGLASYSDDSFGILLSLSHQERKTRLNQAQLDGWLENVDIPVAELNNGDGLPASANALFSPRNYDHKVTFEERTRTNGSLVLQFAPSDDLTITGDIFYSDFDVETDATSYGHWFTAPNIEDATTDANGTVIDLYQEVGLALDMHAKKFDRITQTSAYALNLDWQASDRLNVNFDLHASNAEREANNGGENQLSLIGYANRVRFTVDDNILPLASNFAAADPTIYSGQQEIDGVAYLPESDPNYQAPAGVSNHLDESNSRAHVMLRRGWAVEDDISQFRMDGVWEEGQDTGLVAAKFGLMLSDEEKQLTRWDNETGVHCTYCGYPDGVAVVEQTIFDAGSDFLSDVSGSGRMPTQWLAHDGEAQFALLEELSGLNFDAVRRDNSFTVKEATTAAYLQFEFAGELADQPISATAGVRIERTSVDVSGTAAQLVELTILDLTELNQIYADQSVPISESSDYDAILPSMTVKWELNDTMVMRAAASKSLTRPSLESMSPAVTITTTRQGGDLRSTSGNPDLAPFESDNFDLSFEWYYADTSYLSAGYFKKDVQNFIVNSQSELTFEDQAGNIVQDPSTGEDAVFTNILPNNGETATVDGLEFALQHAFGGSGFGLIFNATLVDSNAELDPENIAQTFALTGLSDSLNLVGFFEKGPFQARLAWNWRDEFVQSLTQVQGNGPTIVEDYEQWDFSASYDIFDKVSLFLEGINLTEEYVHKRGRFDNHLLLIEDSGRRMAFGVRASF